MFVFYFPFALFTELLIQILIVWSRLAMCKYISILGLWFQGKCQNSIKEIKPMTSRKAIWNDVGRQFRILRTGNPQCYEKGIRNIMKSQSRKGVIECIFICATINCHFRLYYMFLDGNPK